MDKRNRERRSRDDEYSVSGAAGAAIHAGGRLALKLPPGTKRFVPTPGKPEEGKTYTGDIVPYRCTGGNPVRGAVDGKRWYERTYYVHNMVGPNRDVVLCNARTFAEKCYICERREKFVQAHPGDWSDDVKRQYRRYATSTRQAFNWWDWSARKAGVQLFDISYEMFGKYLNPKLAVAARKGDKRREFFFKPGKEDGYGLELSPTNKQIEQRTTPEITTFEFVPRKRDIPEEILEAALPLDDIVRDSKLSYKEVRDLFEGGAPVKDEEPEDKEGEEDTDEEEDEEEDDSELDEEDDEDSDDDDDEDDKPEIAVKDVVKFVGKNDVKYRGRVVAIKNGRLKVKTKSGKVLFPDMDDCVVIGDESKNKSSKSKKRPKDEDDSDDVGNDETDDEDDLPPPRRSGKTDKKKGDKKSGKARRGEDEEIPF